MNHFSLSLDLIIIHPKDMTTYAPSLYGLLELLLRPGQHAGALTMDSIKAELAKLRVPSRQYKGLKKADLCEFLRTTIESYLVRPEHLQSDTYKRLAQLRRYEIDCLLTNFDRKLYLAKLKVRDMSLQTDNIVSSDELVERLRPAMEAKREGFLSKQAQYDEEHNCSNDKKKHVLTDEERKRMEENRKRALKLKEEKQAKKQKLALAATPSPHAKIRSSISPPANPYAAANKATPTSTSSETAAADVTIDTTKHRASRVVHITPTSVAKPSSQPAPPTIHSPVSAAPAPPAVPCDRCGLDYDDTSLCTVWTHEGDIHRQRGYNGWDQLRYDCCNRLDPSPCYVGRHVCSSGGRSSSGHRVSMAVACNCGSRATIRRTKKETANKHRLFFTCPNRSCSFFSWCDEAFNLPARRYVKAFDGVDEHRYLHANPFGENLGPGSPPELHTMYQRRRRLVAAVLVNSMQL